MCVAETETRPIRVRVVVLSKVSVTSPGRDIMYIVLHSQSDPSARTLALPCLLCHLLAVLNGKHTRVRLLRHVTYRGEVYLPGLTFLLLL